MEYHTPDDMPPTLNYDGMQQVLEFSQELVGRLSSLSKAPDFINVPSSNTQSHTKIIQNNLNTDEFCVFEMVSPHKQKITIDTIGEN